MNWKSLAWSAAAILLLLTLATPLNFITLFLMMTPFVVLYTMLDLKSFVLHLIPVGIVVFLLSGGMGPMLVTLALFFLVPAIAMGHLYKRGNSARAAVTAGFVIVLAQLLLELALFSALFDIDLRAELTAMLAENFKQLEAANMFEAGWAARAAEEFSRSILSMLPMLLLVTTFLFTIITHGLSRLALRSVPFEAPALPQAKTWKLPRSMVLYFAIAIIASYAVSEEAGGYWWIAIMNLIPILQLVFTIQAIGFVFYISDLKKWPRVISLALCLPILFIPYAFILGLLDTAFPLRKYFEK
ncbi:DUF2232 domain-containing protein [Cohnella hongkongensis]|uniref:DUF2232 domain-containing protein n=1 Tax=Cohnella hongkongensis TaxID=178337 RepID=A0ABV9FMC1_9BACL